MGTLHKHAATKIRINEFILYFNRFYSEPITCFYGLTNLFIVDYNKNRKGNDKQLPPFC